MAKRKTHQQQYISVLMDELGVTSKDLISDLVYIAQNAKTYTRDGDDNPDHKTRLNALKLLLELKGDYTPSK